MLAAPWAGPVLADGLDSGDTAWVLTATVLVLMMTLPGVALLYAGMVRKKNVLSTLMQVFASVALVAVLWVVIGYSLAFDTTGMQPDVFNLQSIVGGFHQFLLLNVELDSRVGTIPETVFVVFQMTFAIITAALVTGAVVERMKFSALLLFIGAWTLLVYAPIAHMVWGGEGALMENLGALDFAGGLVVHINAGVTGLVAALVLGPRLGYGREVMAPHNLVLTLIGGALLWVGWFGFNAGSALAADASAGMAMLVTMIATAVAVLAWIFVEWLSRGVPSLLGAVTGAIAGLVAITPASGYVGPAGALIIGAAAGIASYWGATGFKRLLGVDDSLDTFGVHGVAGIVGALLVGLLAVEAIGGVAGGMGQFVTQLVSVVIGMTYIAFVTWVILKVLDMLIGLRVTEDDELEGLDTTRHGERVE